MLCVLGRVTKHSAGMLSAFMAFIEEGDEVIVFEPFFDQLVHSRSEEKLVSNLSKVYQQH